MVALSLIWINEEKNQAAVESRTEGVGRRKTLK
jgi:hypothetical protein